MQIQNLNFGSYLTNIESKVPKFWSTGTPKIEKDDPTFCKLVQNQGYACEEHQVTTSDDYILTLFRMRSKKVAAKAKGSVPVVHIQHGLFGSSDIWIMTEPQNSIPFVMAQAGYDVWFGNNRGNKYSRHNSHIDPNKDAKTFFDFSFETLGENDVPAIIDYEIKTTGMKKLTWIGHSQGTSQMFAALSTNEDKYADKINLFVALAPIASLRDISLVETAYALGKTDLSTSLVEGAMKSGIYELYGPTWDDNKEFMCSIIPC